DRRGAQAMQTEISAWLPGDPRVDRFPDTDHINGKVNALVIAGGAGDSVQTLAPFAAAHAELNLPFRANRHWRPFHIQRGWRRLGQSASAEHRRKKTAKRTHKHDLVVDEAPIFRLVR